MDATATVATATQEQNRKVARVERTLDQAREKHDRLAGALAMARREKKTLRVVELEPELAEATEAMKIAAQEFKLVTGVDAPLSTGQQAHTKPGTVSALRAANAEFRSLDDEVSRCEHQINKITPQIEQIEATLARQGVLRVSDSPSNPEAERVLDSIYPERVQIRWRNIDNTQRTLRDNIQLQASLAELKASLEKVTREWKKAREKRDAMLADFQAGR